MTIPIRRVTVHRDGALVTRRGTVSAVDGVARVRGLPLLLDEGSVRTTVLGAPVAGVRLQLDLEGLDRTDETAASEELARAKAALQLVQAELAALVEQREWLASASPAVGDSDPLPKPEQLNRWARLNEQFDPWARDLDDRIGQLNRARIEARKRVKSAAHAVDWTSSEAWWQRWAPTRVAVLSVPSDGDIEVEISYRIAGATWTPAYALEADGPLIKGRFTMRALVVQATGEDWSGVALTLSTAPSVRRIDLPELLALRLGARQSPRPVAWRALPTDLDALFPDDDEFDDDDELDFIEEPEPDAYFAGAAAPASAASPERSESAGLLSAFDHEEEDELFEPNIAPMPPVQSMRAKSSSMSMGIGGLIQSRAPSRGGAPARPIPAPILMPKRQDYPSFRLADHTHPPGIRGRLQPISMAAMIRESGLPPAAARHLSQSFEALTTSCLGVQHTTLPPHHVLPQPVDSVDFRFDTDAETDVPSDGRFHSVAVFAEAVKLGARYRTVPQVDPRVFRIVDAQIERSMPLLAGPVDVFVAGDLVLTAPWSGTPGRGNIELGLGVEDALQIARNVRYDELATGLFGGGRRIDTSVEVTIASGLAREVRLEILSRIPVPDDDTIKVEDLQSSPVAEKWEGDAGGPILKGGRRQLVKVPPGGEVVTTLSYGVRIGAKDELIGGDRRG